MRHAACFRSLFFWTGQYFPPETAAGGRSERVLALRTAPDLPLHFTGLISLLSVLPPSPLKKNGL